jgi:hypothetical protein
MILDIPPSEALGGGHVIPLPPLKCSVCTQHPPSMSVSVTGDMLMQAKGGQLVARLKVRAMDVFWWLSHRRGASLPWSQVRKLTGRPPCVQKLTDELETTEQTEDSGFLDDIATALGHAKLLRHRDADVKCCSASRRTPPIQHCSQTAIHRMQAADRELPFRRTPHLCS